MSFDGRAIANFVLDSSEKKGLKVTNLALQKLVYFCHAWTLIFFGRPLVKHPFEAWPHGPVLPYLYHEFKKYGSQYIDDKRSERIDVKTGQKEVVKYTFDEDLLGLLDAVVDVYGRLQAEDLSELSHAKGGPWDGTWNHAGKINPGMKIDNTQIQEFYSKMRAPFPIQ